MTGVHLKEAANINTSLTMLGRVINALATSARYVFCLFAMDAI